MNTPEHQSWTSRTLLSALAVLATYCVLGATSPEGTHATGLAAAGTPSEPAGTDESMPPAGVEESSGSGGSKGSRKVYFAPQDSDATATVLTLFNTRSKPATVSLTGYREDGVEIIAKDIELAPHGATHIVSDTVYAPPPSFANAVYLSFTDYTAWVQLKLPKGVYVDGYVVFNPGTGTIDPRKDQGAIPLRFGEKY